MPRDPKFLNRKNRGIIIIDDKKWWWYNDYHQAQQFYKEAWWWLSFSNCRSNCSRGWDFGMKHCLEIVNIIIFRILEQEESRFHWIFYPGHLFSSITWRYDEILRYYIDRILKTRRNVARQRTKIEVSFPWATVLIAANLWKIPTGFACIVASHC